MLNYIHIIGILLTVGILLAVSILSGRKVKDARSFTTGGTSGSWMVCGAILGTLVGGQSTIGTAQLAFSFGLSAWWFTIGAALGALLLGIVYAKPLRSSGCSTVMEVVRKQFGRRAETVGSILFLIGIFISIVSQLLSSSAMISSLFGISSALALTIGAILIAALVLFGGIRSAGAGGIVKLLLLYICSLAAGVAVFHLAGSIPNIWHDLANIFSIPQVADANAIIPPIAPADPIVPTTIANAIAPTDTIATTIAPSATDPTAIANAPSPDPTTIANAIHHRYASLLARGPLKDLGGCLSLMLGVVCTQTYAQAIWSAKSTKTARRGAVLCAAFIPLIGAACTLVGIYMRGHYITAAEAAAIRAAGETIPDGIGIIENSLQAFPAFIMAHLPAWMGGIALGTLLINILGSGSGLVLGAATIVSRDLVGNVLSLSHRQPRLDSLKQTRLAIVGILLLAIGAALFVRGSFINDLGFLSLGLRAVVLLIPLSFALWFPDRLNAKSVTLSMIVGSLVMLAAGILHLPPDAMYYGLAASALSIALTIPLTSIK